MAVTHTWTPDLDQALRDLHAQDLSLREIAARLGWSQGSISTHAKTIGLTWDRSQTKAATNARVADAAARRSALEVDLLKDAQRLRGQLFAPCKVFNFGGKDNTYEERELPQPPALDQLKIMQATTIALAHSLKIADHDGDAGTEAAVGMLDAIAGEIHQAAERLDT